MKVGFVTASDISISNGYLIRILSELEQLTKRNISVSVLSFLHIKHWVTGSVGIISYAKMLKGLGCKLYLVPVFPDNQIGILYRAVDKYQKWHIHQFIKREQISILHCQATQSAYLAAYAIGNSSLPIVYDMHGISSAEQVTKWGINSPAWKRLEVTESVSISNCRAVISVSAAMQNYWSNRYLGISPKSFVIPCAVDSHLFSFRPDARNTIRSQYNISIEDPVFAYLGSAVSYQRIDKVLEIFRYILSTFPMARLLIISPQSDIPVIKKLMDGMGIHEANAVLVSLAHDDVPKYLSAADFGFLIRDDLLLNNVSSPTKFGEYLGCGVPVIASPSIFDVKSAIQKNYIGFVFEENLDQLMQFIKLVMSKRMEWGQRCAMYVQEQYSWTKYGDLLDDIYMQLTADKTKP